MKRKKFRTNTSFVVIPTIEMFTYKKMMHNDLVLDIKNPNYLAINIYFFKWSFNTGFYFKK